MHIDVGTYVAGGSAYVSVSSCCGQEQEAMLMRPLRRVRRAIWDGVPANALRPTTNEWPRAKSNAFGEPKRRHHGQASGIRPRPKA
jgi:hypothetical protein